MISLSEIPINVICTQNRKKYCTIMLDSLTCDGYHDGIRIGAFSHFHDDHIGAVTDCIREYDVLLTHNVTLDAIAAINPGIENRTEWIPQQYGTVYKADEAKIQLLKANHIPGSAQIHVETDQKSMLYSGDFSYPDVQIRNADYLVLDATHGDPNYDAKSDRKFVMNRLFDDVREKTLGDKPTVIRTSGGTLQEIVRQFEMQEEKISDDVSFIMSTKQKSILHNIYRQEIEIFRNIVDYESEEYWRLLRGAKPFVVFSTSLVLDSDLKKFHQIIIDRYKFTDESGSIIPIQGGCRYNLATHAPIHDIYKYVEQVDPRHVITDYSRSKFAPQLAKMIRRKFPNITTSHRPENTGL